METEEGRDIAGALFVGMVAGIYSQTMQCLGKIMNPATGKIEENLEGARSNIEILRMLKIKTRGNLSGKESSTIDEALSNMQLNYVDSLEKKKSAAAGVENTENQEASDGKDE